MIRKNYIQNPHSTKTKISKNINFHIKECNELIQLFNRINE